MDLLILSLNVGFSFGLSEQIETGAVAGRSRDSKMGASARANRLTWDRSGDRRVSEERLQKILAQAGIASRRKSEEIIKSGRVKVNGQVVTTLGTKADPRRAKIEVGRETHSDATRPHVHPAQ